jgi:hypothetical protein
MLCEQYTQPLYVAFSALQLVQNYNKSGMKSSVGQIGHGVSGLFEMGVIEASPNSFKVNRCQ